VDTAEALQSLCTQKLDLNDNNVCNDVTSGGKLLHVLVLSTVLFNINYRLQQSRLGYQPSLTSVWIVSALVSVFTFPEVFKWSPNVFYIRPEFCPWRVTQNTAHLQRECKIVS